MDKSINVKKYLYIDTLRGYSIIMVFLMHFAMTFPSLYGEYYMSVSLLGRYGITLFFIVSAYSLTASLEYRKKNNEINPIRKYFLRRFFRISPLYYFLIIYGAFVMSDLSIKPNPIDEISIYNIISHILYIEILYPEYINSIIGVEWTLGLEFSFYLILPLIVFLDNRKIRLLFILSILLSVFVMALRKFYFIDSWWLHFTLLEWLYAFVGGIVLYKLKLPSYLTNKAHLIIYIVMLNIFIMSIVKLPFLHYYMFANLMLFFIYIQIFCKNNIFNKIMAFIGKISFSLYLVHYLVLRYAKQYFNESWDIYFASLLLIFTISIITFYAIEKPFINIGRKLINHKQGTL